MNAEAWANLIVAIVGGVILGVIISWVFSKVKLWIMRRKARKSIMNDKNEYYLDGKKIDLKKEVFFGNESNSLKLHQEEKAAFAKHADNKLNSEVRSPLLSNQDIRSNEETSVIRKKKKKFKTKLSDLTAR